MQQVNVCHLGWLGFIFFLKLNIQDCRRKEFMWTYYSYREKSESHVLMQSVDKKVSNLAQHSIDSVSYYQPVSTPCNGYLVPNIPCHTFKKEGNGCVCTACKKKLFFCNLFKYCLRWFVVIHVYITNEKIHIDSKYSVTDIKWGGNILGALDLVALALIPKLAAHFNHLNAVLVCFGKKWGGKTNKSCRWASLCLPAWAQMVAGSLLQWTRYSSWYATVGGESTLGCCC